MYCNHFGLTKAPFKITPDPEFFFPGGNRGAVLEALIYAISRGEGIVKVVGEVGSGKTMLCRMLEREMPEQCEVVYLANPRLTSEEILYAIAFELGIEVAESASKLEVMHALTEALIRKHANSSRVAVFVEEAQAMPLDTLEEIRMLSNLETTRDKLLQIVLFGQPELNAKLDRHDIRQLKERITYGFELAPFKPAEISEYINTRLRASGYRGSKLFSDRAVKVLSGYSRGLLRRINILADKALLAAFSRGEAGVTPRHVKMAARDSEFSATHAVSLRLATALVLAAVLGAFGAAAWLSVGEPRTTAVAAVVAPVTASTTLAPPATERADRDPVVDGPREHAVLETKYEDLTAISTTFADDSTNRLVYEALPWTPTVPAGMVVHEVVQPDLRPYLELRSLRERLGDRVP